MRLVLLVWCLSPVSLTAAESGRVEVLRDEFGVPHIFARTAEEAMFASGYLQAEDRLDELHINLRKALGTMAEAFGARDARTGEDWLRHDWKQRMWEHARIARSHYAELPPKIRTLLEYYTRGIEHYKESHPSERKAEHFRVEPWHIVAYSRYTVWRWHEGDAADDLRRGGIEPDPVPYRGSNQMLIAASRTAMGAPIAIIDPHLSWYGETRYYEMRIYGGKELAYSGGARVGLPFPTLGHSRHVSIAMTTGGPDTADVFEEEVREGKYRFRDEWKPLRVEREKIGVLVSGRIEWKEFAFEYTHHGPIWAHHNGRAYSMATPYASEFRLVEQAWNMVTARNLGEMKRALAMRQYMAQNIMVGTVEGDIFYLRNGRVPIRPKGCDPSKPMPGGGSCEWEGIHPIEDLVQVHNPPQGYMQNNNCPPEVMMKDSPMTPDRWRERPYLYNDSRREAHQRAAMTLDQLSSATNVTAEQAIGLAFSTQVHRAELWQERIRRADPSAGLLLTWDRRAEAGSRGALAYYLLKMALGPHSRAVVPPATLTDDDVRNALQTMRQRLEREFPPDATYGSLFRVGRRGSPRTFPVGGGTLPEAGMATPRAITFQKQGDAMVGVGGQTQTQIVVLTKRPQSWMILPLGQSDRPESPHFDDQAEKLFSRSRPKPTFFDDRKELEKHVESRQTIRVIAK
jgi:acyl-homoserine lactone acylase PvdQ